MKLPKKITPCPITETIIEIRFESDVPEDAIFGVIYNEFKQEYSSFEKLPILQIPEVLRSRDPNLMFNPHYKSQAGNFLLQIGPKVFSLVNIEEYAGWEVFSGKIYSTFSALAELKIIKKVTRFGLRYINLFDGINIYEKSNFTIALNKIDFGKHNMNMTIEIPADDNYVNHLRMINRAQIRIEKEIHNGSIIDIDTVRVNFSGDFFATIREIAETAHIHEKTLFFSLLKEDFIASLNPVY
jgi:uncharacterized protein (TIGR04255 family)